MPNLPPRIAPFLPIIVEQLEPGPVGQVVGVAPQQEHEDDDQDVLGCPHPEGGRLLALRDGKCVQFLEQVDYLGWSFFMSSSVLLKMLYVYFTETKQVWDVISAKLKLCYTA